MTTIVTGIAVYGVIGTLGFFFTDPGLRRKGYPPCRFREKLTYIIIWPVYLPLLFLAEYLWLSDR